MRTPSRATLALLFLQHSLVQSVSGKRIQTHKRLSFQCIKPFQKQCFLRNLIDKGKNSTRRFTLRQFGSMSETVSRVRQLTEKGAKVEGWNDCWK
jgi:hypothetical protein